MLAFINRQTLEFARSNGVAAIDVSGAFATHDPNPLFYDSVHYSEKGARLFASIVNRALERGLLDAPPPGARPERAHAAASAHAGSSP